MHSLRLRRPAVVVLAFSLLLGLASVAKAEPVGSPPPLSERDARVLERGLYTRNEILGGGFLGSTVGFGSGHAVQGRWRETGWIYTAGETASLGALIGGTAACSSDQNDEDGLEGIFETTDCLLAVSLISTGAFVVFRVAELIDVWAHPQVHNRRFREIEERRARQALRWSPYVVPNDEGGAAFGLALQF